MTHDKTPAPAPAVASFDLARAGEFFQAQLDARRVGRAPAAPVLDLDALTNHLFWKKPKEPAAVILELTARHPWEPEGFIDGYQVGRWDAGTDTIYMTPIVNGPTLGEWDGSVLYGQFTAPAAGTYRVMVPFYGWQITMRVSGPWGASLATSVGNAPAVVAGDMTMTAGQATGFSINCTGLYVGYVQKVLIARV